MGAAEYAEDVCCGDWCPRCKSHRGDHVCWDEYDWDTEQSDGPGSAS